MNKILIVSSALLLIAGCKAHGSRGYTSRVSPVYSEREYADRKEAVAQQILKSGGASNLSDARNQAQAQLNEEWGRAAKAREAQVAREKFERDLAKSVTTKD